MTELKNSMIDEAMDNHGTISPCGSRETLHDCFTIEDDMLLFWYNCPSNSTHLITKNI